MPNDQTTDRAAAAQVRVRVALASIQEAQSLLGQAAQAVCSVNGLAAEWRRVGKLYGQVKRAWYSIDGKAAGLRFQGRLVLDHEPTAHETRWAALHEGR
jgi:hypothetical protein